MKLIQPLKWWGGKHYLAKSLGIRGHRHRHSGSDRDFLLWSDQGQTLNYNFCMPRSSWNIDLSS